MNHIQLTKEVSSYPGRLLNSDEKALVKDMYCANVADGVISNVIFEKTGQWLSRQNMKHVTSLCEVLRKLPNIKNASTSDQMIHFIQDSQYDYILLLHNPIISCISNSMRVEDECLVIPENQNCSFSNKEKSEINGLYLIHVQHSISNLPNYSRWLLLG